MRILRMSSNDERSSSKQINSSADYNSIKSFTILISSVTGHKWEESVTLCETVDSLKMKIWHRTGLFPYHQGLIFDDLSLSELCGQTLLYELGVRNNSLVRLVVITRSGPLALTVPEKLSAVPCSVQTEQNKGDCWEELRLFDEQNLDENRRTLFRMCELRRQMKQNASAKPIINASKQVLSAPEDTSAKESSAGDTECDDDKSCSCSGISSSAKVFETAALSGAKNGDRRNRQNANKEEAPNVCHNEPMNNSARDRLLIMMNPRAASPTTDLNTHSEDGSEFSSGMVVCDLSNEFRRLRVRRKHHGAGNGSATIQRTRTRSKPRIPLTTLSHHHRGSDVTSSDDDLPRRRITEANFSCSAFRRPSAVSRAQKVLIGYQSQQRCSACAVKLNNFSVAFQCRCGKTLCARHRPAGMHTCTRVRKLQDNHSTKDKVESIISLSPHHPNLRGWQLKEGHQYGSNYFSLSIAF
ncbi:Zinc finger A20 and AN1 domain-containing stress-associated protein [Dirofilaria immitis]